MKLVKFNDGTFGVRRWSFWLLGYEYADLVTPHFWWGFNGSYFICCKGSESSAQKVFDRHSDKGTPV